jgi:hypothetical protein
MKTFSFILILLISLSQSGCAELFCKKPVPDCKPEIKIVHDIVYVNKEIPCKDLNVTCDFTGDGGEPTKNLLKCIIIQKRALDACSAKQ